MSDQGFEKQVQARMDELKFRPSDLVWKKVERKIWRARRRKRLVLVMPLLLLLLGAGGFYFWNDTRQQAPVVATKDHHLPDQNTSSDNNSTLPNDQLPVGEEDSVITKDRANNDPNADGNITGNNGSSAVEPAPVNSDPQNTDLKKADLKKADPTNAATADPSVNNRSDNGSNNNKSVPDKNKNINNGSVTTEPSDNKKDEKKPINDQRRKGKPVISNDKIDVAKVSGKKDRTVDVKERTGINDSKEQDASQQTLASAEYKIIKRGNKASRNKKEATIVSGESTDPATLAANDQNKRNAKNNNNKANNVKAVQPPVTTTAGDLLAFAPEASLPAASKGVGIANYQVKHTVTRQQLPGVTRSTRLYIDPALVARQKNQKEKARKARLNLPAESDWSWGITALGGGSNLSKGNVFELLSKSSTQQEDLAAAVTRSTLALAAPTPTPSAIKTGSSYTAGGFVKKNISRRLSMSAGLQYNYFSVGTSVGNLVNDYTTVNNALSNSQVVDQYYRGSSVNASTAYYGTDQPEQPKPYTNIYHFVDFPVNLHVKLTEGRKMSLIWDGGVVVSQLVRTNALHYDGANDVYYEDNGFFNKTQFSLATGFNVALFQKNANPIWLGPRVNYQLSNLLKKEISDGQHLWSFGIQARLLLKK